MQLIQIFLAVGVGLGLTSLGFALGVLFENMRMRAIYALERQDREEWQEDTGEFLVNAIDLQSRHLEQQNKKLDTLIMCQASQDIDSVTITQKMPVIASDDEY